jgi:putative hydrolase
MTGLVAKTALGQFDAGLPPAPGRGSFLVVPNLEAFAAASVSDVRQIRLWAALSEAVHQAQSAVPWVGEHLSGLFARCLTGLDLNPEMLQERLGSFDDPSALEEIMSEPGGLGGLMAGPEQQADLDEIRAFLAFLAGHRMALVARIGGHLLPDLETIEDAAAGRHAEGGEAGRMLEQLIGVESDPSLAGAAAGFCEEVARRWGEEAAERIWDDPEALPTASEIADPVGWAARVLLEDDGLPEA